MGKLINKSFKQYEYISRYSTVPYYYDEQFDKYVYGTAYNLRTDTPYIIHIAKERDTFDTLALKYYNNPTLYWVICDFNRIQNPFSEIEVGDKIKVPTLSSISFIINS